MSASPVSSPDTLSAEQPAEALVRCASLDDDGVTVLRFDVDFVARLYKSHEALREEAERLRALLSERPTLSQAEREDEADALIVEFDVQARKRYSVMTGDGYSAAYRIRVGEEYDRARAALRAALLGEKP